MHENEDNWEEQLQHDFNKNTKIAVVRTCTLSFHCFAYVRLVLLNPNPSSLSVGGSAKVLSKQELDHTKWQLHPNIAAECR